MFKTLELSASEWILLADTLQDILQNGEIDQDLKDYLDSEDNPFVDLYLRLISF